MSYSDFGDIQAEFKNINFNATSAVTEAQVNDFITQEEAVINATISNRYETPITGANAILVMQKISIAYVAYRVAQIINLKKNVPIPEKFVAQELNEGSAFKKAEKNLISIQSGKIVLNDAVARSNEQGVKSFNALNNIGSLWNRDAKQW